MSHVPHAIRPVRAQDMGFCGDGWLRSMVDAPQHRWIPMPIALQHMRARIAHWLQEHADKTYVAHAAGDDDLLLGFICAPAPDTCFYLYVKHAMRRMGLARSLMTHALPYHHGKPTFAAHWGESCANIAIKHPNLIYDPTTLKDPRRWESLKMGKRQPPTRAE